MAKNIRKDLELGRETEEKVRDEINKIFGLETEINPNYRTEHYDLRCNKTGLTFEVKFDKYEAKSNNLCFEYWNPKSNKPSGISLTTAKYWIHVLDKPFTIYIAETKKLKNFIENTKPLKIIKYGGDGNSSMYLYRKEIILPVFEELKNWKLL